MNFRWKIRYHLSRHKPLAVFAATGLFSLAAAFVMFNDRWSIAHAAIKILLIWIPLALALHLTKIDQRIFDRGPRSALLRFLRSDLLFAAFAFALIPAVLVVALVTAKTGLLARHLLQIGFFWLPLYGLLHAQSLIKHYKQILLLLGSASICIFLLWLTGPLILRAVILSDVHMNLQPAFKLPEGLVNEDGVQPAIPAEQYSEDDFVILFLGDSFPFGWGLADQQQSFPFLVEAALSKQYPAAKVRLVNFGRIGTSPILQYRQLARIGKSYHPDLVLQSIDMTDFHNDVFYKSKLDSNEEMRVSIFHAIYVALRLWLGIPDGKLWLVEQLAEGKPGQEPPWDPDLTKPLQLSLYALLTGDSVEGFLGPRPWLEKPDGTRGDGTPPGSFREPQRRPGSPFHELPVRRLGLGEPEEKDDHLDHPNVKYYFPLWQPLEKSAPQMEITWREIERTAELSRKLGAKYAVFVLPRYQQYNPEECPDDWEKSLFPKNDAYLLEPFKFFEAKSDEAPFPVHSLLTAFQQSDLVSTVGEKDGHYNAAGHQIAAEAILRFMYGDGLVPGETQ
jgi:hypothetical protein